MNIDIMLARGCRKLQAWHIRQIACGVLLQAIKDWRRVQKKDISADVWDLVDRHRIYTFFMSEDCDLWCALANISKPQLVRALKQKYPWTFKKGESYELYDNN